MSSDRGLAQSAPVAGADEASGADQEGGAPDADHGEEEEDDDEEEKILGPWGGIIAMVIATIFISILSQLIVDAVDGAASSLDIPGALRLCAFVNGHHASHSLCSSAWSAHSHLHWYHLAPNCRQRG